MFDVVYISIKLEHYKLVLYKLGTLVSSKMAMDQRPPFLDGFPKGFHHRFSTTILQGGALDSYFSNFVN